MKKALITLLICLPVFGFAQFPMDILIEEVIDTISLDSAKYSQEFEIDNEFESVDTVYWEFTRTQPEEWAVSVCFLPNGCYPDPMGVFDEIVTPGVDHTFKIETFFNETCGDGDYQIVFLESPTKLEVLDQLNVKINIPCISNLDETKLVDLIVYPNPTTDFLVVSRDDLKQVYITSTDGRVFKPSQSGNQIDVSNLIPGNYILYGYTLDEQPFKSNFIKN